MQRGELWVGGLLKEPLGYMSSYGQKMMFVMLHVPVCWNPTKPLVSWFHCSTCLASLIATVNVTMNMQEVGDGHCFWWIFLYVNKTTWLMQYHCSIIFRTISQLWVDDVFKPDLISQVCHGKSCRFQNIPHTKPLTNQWMLWASNSRSETWTQPQPTNSWHVYS